MSKFQHLTRAIVSRPWAIDPESIAWAAILDVLAIRASGETLSDQEIEARISAAQNGPRAGRARNRNVAVIPVYGVISPRQNLMARSSGGTSAESIREEFRAALEDQDVDGIVFDVDSPGGVVEGISELANEIRAGRGTKPIVAVANHQAASAAYWIAAAADEIVATPSATLGSIGVFTAHQDVSERLAREGVKTTLIKAGRFKAEGSQFEPLSEEALAAKQADVDEWFGMMTRDIAAGRGVSVDQVRGEAFGEGRTLFAKKAVANGVADRIGSLDETIRRVARGAVTSRPAGRSSDTGAVIVPVEGDVLVGAAAATTFVARVEAAAAEVRAIGEEARKRADLRAEDGREPSKADLLALDRLRASLDAETEENEDDEEESDGDQPDGEATASAPAKRLGLELFEAATSRGYALPH